MTPQQSKARVTHTRLQTTARDAQSAARDAADQAGKASAHAALWLFVMLLIAAFVVSVASTLEGDPDRHSVALFA